jgi:hypothetical protein
MMKSPTVRQGGWTVRPEGKLDSQTGRKVGQSDREESWTVRPEGKLDGQTGRKVGQPDRKQEGKFTQQKQIDKVKKTPIGRSESYETQAEEKGKVRN